MASRGKNLEVITYTADMGQGDIPEDLEDRAKGFGAIKVIVDDLSDEFVSNYVFPMFRCNTLYEGNTALGTAIARPLIAKFPWRWQIKKVRILLRMELLERAMTK